MCCITKNTLKRNFTFFQIIVVAAEANIHLVFHMFKLPNGGLRMIPLEFLNRAGDSYRPALPRLDRHTLKASQDFYRPVDAGIF